MPQHFTSFDPPLREFTKFDYTNIHRNLGRPPRWTFPNLLKGYGLRAIRLNFDNFDQLWPVLAAGDTTFIDPRYRNHEKLYAQVLFLLDSTVYSGTNGACDWMLVETDGGGGEPKSYEGYWFDGRIQLGENERIVGVLHLYEMSHERLLGHQTNPLVGLQIGGDHRGRGLGTRAIQLLTWYLGHHHPDVIGLTANIKKANVASIALFENWAFAKTMKTIIHARGRFS